MPNSGIEPQVATVQGEAANHYTNDAGLSSSVWLRMARLKFLQWSKNEQTINEQTSLTKHF